MTSTTYELLEFGDTELSIVIPAYTRSPAHRTHPRSRSPPSWPNGRSIAKSSSSTTARRTTRAQSSTPVTATSSACACCAANATAAKGARCASACWWREAESGCSWTPTIRPTSVSSSDSTTPRPATPRCPMWSSRRSQLRAVRSTTRSHGPARVLGRMGDALVQRAVLPGIHDSQRGFKLFTAEAADAIFALFRINGWGFDIEVLAIARTLGFDILEVPVRWHHEEDSRVGPTAYLTTLIDVARVRRSVRKRNGKAAVHGKMPTRATGCGLVERPSTATCTPSSKRFRSSAWIDQVVERGAAWTCSSTRVRPARATTWCRRWHGLPSTTRGAGIPPIVAPGNQRSSTVAGEAEKPMMQPPNP